MKIVRPIDVDLRPDEARARQRELAAAIPSQPGPTRVELIGSADVAYHKETGRAYAAVVVLEASSLEVVDQASWEGEPGYPYVPGLFSLREASCSLQAFARLETTPEVILVDGHGVAHPRRFGLACLLGWALDVPTVGCAKNNLCGEYQEPGLRQGDRSPILDSGERIGLALRTQDAINPVFVSPGWGYDVTSAAELVLGVAGEYRIPEPLRQAHNLSVQLRMAADEGVGA